MMALKAYTTDFVVSKDGTKIGYRQMGSGLGLILIHGGMQAAQNLMTLGTLLAASFTVYIPDRRGRGLSGGYDHGYSLTKECEDLEAILNRTGAQNVFGLSSGAIIALESARRFSSIHQVALYEPPLPFDGIRPDAWVPRYDKEMTQGKLAEAMVSVLKGTGDSWSISRLPRFILVPLLRLGIKANSREVKDDDVAIKELIPTMHYDALLLAETRSMLDLFKNVTTKVLLLSGSRSNPFLKKAIKRLQQIFPRAGFIQFPGLGHTAADNGEKPAVLARELNKFFRGN